MRAALVDVWPLAGAAVQRAAGRSFEDLDADEFSVLAEPGTIGAILREVWARGAEQPGVRPEFVTAALHHRYPRVLPHLDVTTRRQLWPHVREGDSGPEAVVHRELRANAAGFAALEEAVAALLPDERVPSRLRLHDVLLWLAGSLPAAHCPRHGKDDGRVAALHGGHGRHDGLRPVSPRMRSSTGASSGTGTTGPN